MVPASPALRATPKDAPSDALLLSQEVVGLLFLALVLLGLIAYATRHAAF